MNSTPSDSCTWCALPDLPMGMRHERLGISKSSQRASNSSRLRQQQQQRHDVLELTIPIAPDRIDQTLGFVRRQIAVALVIFLEQRHTGHGVFLGPWYLPFLGEVEHIAQQNKEPVGRGWA